MHGIIRLLPGGEVAASRSASCRRNVQVVIIVDVTQHAGYVCVAIRQRKSKCCVIEFSIRPLGDGVARSASRRVIREAGLDMVGNIAAKRRRLIPRRRMTAHAVCRLQRVVVINVARRARNGCRRHMTANQCEAGHAVVEGSRIPALCSVAIRAVPRRESRARRGVHGIIRLLPLRKVTTGIPAIGRSNLQGVIVVDVARSAGNIGVAVRQ